MRSADTGWPSVKGEGVASLVYRIDERGALARRVPGSSPMDGILTYFWDFPHTSPKTLGRTRRDTGQCGQLFQERLTILIAKYGEPERTVSPVWYPDAGIACRWPRDD